MDLRALLRVISRNLVVIIAVVVVAVAAAGVVTAVTPKSFETETKVLMEPQLRTSEPDAIVQASTLVSAQAQTYALLATTPTVLDPAITDSGVDTTSIDLVDNVTVTLEPETAIITITVDSDSGEDAAKLANGISTNLIDQIQTRSGEGDVGLTGSVVEAPIISTEPASPDLLINLAVGLAAGLALALIVVAFRHALEVSAPTAGTVTTAPAVTRRVPVKPAGLRPGAPATADQEQAGGDPSTT